MLKKSDGAQAQPQVALSSQQPAQSQSQSQVSQSTPIPTPKAPSNPSVNPAAKALAASSVTPGQILAEAAARLQNMRLAALRAPSRSSMAMLGGDLGFSDSSGSGDVQGIEGEFYGLIDSGATHALRYAGWEEIAQSVQVEVELAQGKAFFHRNRVHVLLTDDPNVVPIIPMSALVTELQCKAEWSEGGLHIYHPALGSLPIRMLSGCPHLPRSLTGSYKGPRSVKG